MDFTEENREKDKNESNLIPEIECTIEDITEILKLISNIRKNTKQAVIQ